MVAPACRVESTDAFPPARIHGRHDKQDDRPSERRRLSIGCMPGTRFLAVLLGTMG